MQVIVLKKNLFDESNEIVTFFSKDEGKIRAVARSVKSNKSKLAFGLQPLFYSDVELARSKKLHVIKGLRLLNAFKNIRANEQKVFLALHAAEIVLKSTADEQPNENLFELLLTFLSYLDEVPPRHIYHSIDVFTLKALSAIGYQPELSLCTVCGKNLRDEFNTVAEQEVFFSNRKGGAVCSADAQKVSDATRINPEVYRFLLNYSTLDFAQADRQDLPEGQLRELTESFAAYILERELKTGRYL